MVKLTNTNILSAFRKQMGISKADEIAFAEAFQSIFEEALLRDKVLKINGLGTFKLIPVESRKSVNVNTGEEIEIAGHYKLTFTPDALLKDKVNEPLAHLETIELDEDVVVKNQEKIPLNTQYSESHNDLPDAQEDPLQKLAEQAAELKDILSDIKAIDLGIQSNESIVDTPSEVNAIATNNEAIQEGEIKDEIEVQEEKRVDSSAINNSDIKDAQVVEQETQTPKNKPETLVSAKDIISEINNENGYSHNNRSWIWIMTAVVLFLVIIALLLYQNRDFFIGQPTQEQEQEQEQKHDSVMVDDFVVEEQNTDTLTSNFEVETTEELVEVTEAIDTTTSIDKTSLIYSDKFADIFNYKREYVEYLDTISLNGGKRLALVSLEYYGYRDYWVYIFEANRDIIKNPNSIQIGTKLRIPKLAPELIDTTNPETIEYARYLHDIYVQK